MPSEIQKPKVVFSVINSICYDQRVLKMAETVAGLGCEITIVGRKTDKYCNENLVSFKMVRFSMFFKKGFFFYKFFNIRLFFYLLFNTYDLLVANDLDTLLPNYLVSKLKRLPLIYDSHEYFTGVPELQNRHLVKGFWRSLEKMILPRLKNVITVSEPIAALYEKMYQVRPLVVRNISKRAVHVIPYTREEIGIPSDALFLILQGTGINIDKGAEELIDAVSKTDGVALLIVGSGDVVPKLKYMVSELNLGLKVKFIDNVPWEKLMKYTKAADVGMCLEKDTNLNYRFSLPNKLFDYIVAGIPVIAGDLPESAKIIRENSCGLIIECVTPGNIIKAVSELRGDSGRLAELRRNSVKAAEKLNWDIESGKVVVMYENVLKVVSGKRYNG